MSEVEDAVKEPLESSDFSLNPWIALAVAVTATCMAVGNIKDGNIVQAMAQVQAKGVDAWSYYQAKSTKQILASNMAEQLRTQMLLTPNLSAETRAKLDAKVAQYEADAKRYEKEKEEIENSKKKNVKKDF